MGACKTLVIEVQKLFLVINLWNGLQDGVKKISVTREKSGGAIGIDSLLINVVENVAEWDGR